MNRHIIQRGIKIPSYFWHSWIGELFSHVGIKDLHNELKCFFPPPSLIQGEQMENKLPWWQINVGLHGECVEAGSGKFWHGWSSVANEIHTMNVVFFQRRCYQNCQEMSTSKENHFIWSRCSTWTRKWHKYEKIRQLVTENLVNIIWFCWSTKIKENLVISIGLIKSLNVYQIYCII